MKNKCKRIYSTEEIRQMCLVEFEDDFVEYLQQAPDSVQHAVEKMLPHNFDKNLFYQMCERKECNAVLDEDIVVDESDNMAEEDGYIKDEPLFDKVEQMQESNPYAELDFSDRLEVEKLIVTLTEETRCPIHKQVLKPIQVVFLYKNGKRFGSYVNCCSECKKLYMNTEDYNDLREILERKEILISFGEQ